MIHLKDNNGNWTVVVNNKSYQFNSNHPEYVNLVKAVRKDDDDAIVELMEQGTKIDNWSEGNFTFKDGVLLYDFEDLNEEVEEGITKRVISHMRERIDYQYLLNFISKVYQNESHRAVYEGFKFFANHHMPITKDGCVIAYKAVKTYHGSPVIGKDGVEIREGDLVDKWTGCSHRNNVGDTPNMKRRLVDDNCGHACAAGLHAGSTYYAKSYGCPGDTAILVKIDPRDLVTVPTCDSEKVRVCRYEVIGLYNGDLIPPLVDTQKLYDDEWEEDNYDDEDWD